MNVLQTAVMNAAGISVTRYFIPLLFFARKTVRAQSVNTANVWLAQPKYFQMVLKPSLSAMLNQSRRAEAMKIGMLTISLLRIGVWSMWKVSATIILALLREVSPLVIGAATTPSMDSIPPRAPSHLTETADTIAGAEALMSDPTSAAPPSKKK